MAVENAVDYYDTVIIMALNSCIVQTLGVPGGSWGSNLIKLMGIIDAIISVKVLTKVTQTLVQITAKKIKTLGPQRFKTFIDVQ